MMNEKELPVNAALDRMGIEYTRIEHPVAATMEACAAIGEGTGASHCKNLFLTNRQGTAFFLVMLGSSKKFRTASVSKQLGAARLSFTTAEQLENILGLTQGSVTVTGPWSLKQATSCVFLTCSDTNSHRLRLKTRMLPFRAVHFARINRRTFSVAKNRRAEYNRICRILRDTSRFCQSPLYANTQKGRTRSESGFRSCKKLNRLKRIF